MTALELNNVSFHYFGCSEEVLRNACFSVDYGEIALLSGCSGTGKSTVLSLLSGIIPNTVPGEIKGEVLVDGENISGKAIGEICRKVGIVLQNADSQIIQQLVEDEIAFGCENFGFSIDEISKSIDFACTQMKLNKGWKTRTLSGGQKQRLITASTLATKQKILILDEPLANLDNSGARMLMQTLRKLAQQGYAVLLVEHRLDSVINYVDSVWAIDDRQINRIQDKQLYLKKQAIKLEAAASVKPSDINIFKLENVCYSAGGRSILNGINLEIKKGERLLLQGENGCGKTTLLRLLARLSKPTSGVILQNIDRRFGNKSKANARWFKKVGVVYQNPNYQLFMPTVRQEVAFGADSPEYLEKIMTLFNLNEIAQRHPHSLSEGQKRLVSIAAVLAAKPEVLLLDEPTVGQDYGKLNHLVQILNEVHNETCNTMITVTHDNRCAAALCDTAVHITTPQK